MNTHKEKNFKADYLGMLSAGLCLIHCVLLPIVFAWRAVNFEHDVEGIFKWDYIFLVISFYAVYQAAKTTISPIIRWALWASFILLTTSIILESYAEVFEYIIIFASVCLVIIHFFNLRYCQHEACASQNIA
ncbi:MAG: MerC domain-containing protein [Thermoflexibacter sp.]|jgi:hypothetical protein|nr:MerC domain-containing protein [Thermoflexibacter sp.]